jgi:signal transduction histidine kinase
MSLFEGSNLLRLRTIAIVIPVTFAIGLGIFTDQVLEQLFSRRVAQVLATAILTLSVIAFAYWIFGVLERMQAVIARQRERERDQAAAVARMEERERIGVDLHDGVIQTVYGVQLTLERCLTLLESQPDVSRCVNDSIEDLTAVSGKMRQYIFALRPYLDGPGDLSRALTDLFREAEANSSVETQLDLDELVVATIGEEEALALFDIAREGLTSAVRRGATHIAASLKSEGGSARLEINDDGSAQ